MIPEEEVWLASRKSARTRRAYRTDVAHFMRTFNITSPEELRKVDHRAVMAWERLMRRKRRRRPRRCDGGCPRSPVCLRIS